MKEINKIINSIYPYLSIKNFFILLIIIIPFSIYNSDTIMFRKIDLLDQKTGQQLNLMNTRNIIMKKMDNFYIFNNNFFNIPSKIKIPLYDIKLSKENVDYINGVIERSLDMSSDKHKKVEHVSFFDNKFSEVRNTKIIFNNNEYQGKLKLHGKTHFQWGRPKKSFSIRLKNENLINNVRSFGLVIFDEQHLGTLFSYDVARLYNFMDVKSEVAQLRINGIDQGLYIFEEKASKELLEKNGLSGYDIIKVNDEWTTQYLHAHIMPFSDEESYVEIQNFSERDVGQLSRYKQLMQAENYDSIVQLIDIDRFAQHEAMRILFGDDHAVAGDNLRLLYDTTTGKFSPYFRMEGYLKKLEYTKFSKTFDQELNNYENTKLLNQQMTFDKELNNYFVWSIDLFKKLNQNNDFRIKRNLYLNQILEDKDILIKMYDDLMNTYKPLIKRDKTNNYSFRWYWNEIDKQRENLVFNLQSIERYLSYSRVYSSIEKQNDNSYLLKISPDSNSPLKINEISFEGIDKNTVVEFYDHQTDQTHNIEIERIPLILKDTNFMLNLDDNLEIKKNALYFSITLKNDFIISNYSLSFINDINGANVESKNIWLKNLSTSSKVEPQISINKLNSIEEFQRYPEINIVKNNIIFNENKYEFEEDIILPYGYNLILLDGVEILLSKGKSIIVYGDLQILGDEKKVLIGNKNPGENFGVVGALGNENSKIFIKGLDLYGGSEDYINGVYLSGALSLYSHKIVEISNSMIHHNSADDGLNVKNAKLVKIYNNEFYSNAADQIDCDFCNGVVSFNIFDADGGNINELEIAMDTNGDGIDFSGSVILLKENRFENFKDKGVSVGEKTKLLLSKNNFLNNRSAVTVKDESDAYFHSNFFTNNDIDLEMYIKKNIFNEPEAFITDYSFRDNRIISANNLENIYYINAIEDFLITDNAIKTIENLENLSWN